LLASHAGKEEIKKMNVPALMIPAKLKLGNVRRKILRRDDMVCA